MSTTQSSIMNGVDVGRLVGTIEAVQADPGLAQFRFRAHNAWISGGNNRSTIKGFRGAGGEDETRTEAFVYDNDEPDVLLGTDRGAYPVEYVLHALAGCLTLLLEPKRTHVSFHDDRVVVGAARDVSRERGGQRRRAATSR